MNLKSYVCKGQMNIFDFLEQKKPGDWVEEEWLGKEISFDEIAESVGELIVLDKSTESHAWYKVVRVEKIIPHEGRRRLIYYDGCKQRGLINERYFDKGIRFRERAWRLKA